jgi:hypothetical protein
METKEEFPIMMKDDSDEVETHRIVYLYPEDIANFNFAIELALQNPKVKFSKRYSNLVQLQKQLKNMK